MKIATSRITAGQYQALLTLSEGHFIDIKGIDIKPANATKTVSAFANASGGELYIGIEEIIDADGWKRIWRGFENEEAANGLIQAIEAMSPLGNHYEANFLSTDETPGLVLQLTIFKSPDVIYASNQKAYVRRGAQKLPVEGDQALERLRFDKGVKSFEDQLVDCELEEITNSVAIIDFVIQVIPTVEPEPWLLKQRLIMNNRASVAGILLFADEPQAILPKRSAIKIYRYKTKEEEGERDYLAFDPISIEGPAYELIYRTIDKCKEIIEDIEKLGPSGLEKVFYPQEALHEIITNAVLHRDYSIVTDIHVRIFDNRVEIESPGKLPGHVTIENILREQFARNPKLVRLINKFPNPPNKDVGEGLNTAFEAMEKLRLKPPVIEELDNSVVVSLRHERLASPEQTVIEYLGNHPEITNSIARDLTGIKSENTMKDVFYHLRDRGLIEPVPGKKGRSSAWRMFKSS
jgi:ATP-dependent DNA helicase RecG